MLQRRLGLLPVIVLYNMVYDSIGIVCQPPKQEVSDNGNMIEEIPIEIIFISDNFYDMKKSILPLKRLDGLLWVMI